MPQTLKYIQCTACESIYPRDCANDPCFQCQATENWQPWDPMQQPMPDRAKLLDIIDSLVEGLDICKELWNEEDGRLYNDVADAIIALTHHFADRQWYYMEEEITVVQVPKL
jgi:hypothetical protein